MGRWWYLIALGFLLSWPLPVAGVAVMVLGAVATAIASERALLPEFLRPSERVDEPTLRRRAAG
jgi:apolipoprotein N-acyltransferase